MSYECVIVADRCLLGVSAFYRSNTNFFANITAFSKIHLMLLRMCSVFVEPPSCRSYCTYFVKMSKTSFSLRTFNWSFSKSDSMSLKFKFHKLDWDVSGKQAISKMWSNM